MKDGSTMETLSTIGLDLGDRVSEAFVLAAAGDAEVERFKVATSAPALRARFAGRARSRVILEASGPSPWVSRLLTELGHEVVVADTRRLALITRSDRKSDRRDAEKLARLGRADLALVGEVKHRSARAQADLEVLRARDALVRCRTALINHVRGVLKSLGCRARTCSARAFDQQAREAVPAEVRVALEPVLDQVGTLTAQIRLLDRRVEEMAEKEHPEAQPLMKVNGVGALTALAFVLVLGDPHRFAKSRKVGAYVGLTPARRQSGERDPQLSISKAGNTYLRRLLVGCAHYMLGPFGRDSALRRHGLALCERGGPSAKKRAVVAVARRLAVLLHRLWVSGEPYEPLRDARPSPAPAATA